jgi:hypothetical protein
MYKKQNELTREQEEIEMDAAYDIEYQAHLKGIPTQKYMELMTLTVNERTEVMGEDYEIGDEFDWDRSDKSQYCKHGKFIGSWWGPDILCGKCEMGDGPMNISEDDYF